MVGLSNIPSVNMIHHYLVTENHPEIEKRDIELPVVRDPYSNCYLRQEAKGLIVGVYEKNAKAWALDGMDWRFDMELLEPELERIEDNNQKNIEEELGDILIGVVNLSRFLNVSAEVAMQKANKKFYKRFTKMEKFITKDKKEIDKLSLAELDIYWKKVKDEE